LVGEDEIEVAVVVWVGRGVLTSTKEREVRLVTLYRRAE
jgi:hypothetical protein